MINALEHEIDVILKEAAPTKETMNHLISDKIIYPKSIHFGKKGESYMVYSEGVEQWYFKPKGEEDFIRVKWWALDSNVSEGSYGMAEYIGINPTIQGKTGQLTYTSRKWLFVVGVDEEDKYVLVNPDSVRLL